MLRAHRRGYHALAAGWLAAVTEQHGRADEFAAVIAEHTDRAGDPAAARWYLRAGSRAARVYASEEALRLLGRGLDVVADDDPVLRFDLLREREQVADRLAERDRQRADLDLMGSLLDAVDVPRRLQHALARARLAFDSREYDDSVRWAGEAAATAAGHGLDDEAAQGHLWAGKALTWASQGARARTELEAALVTAQRAGLRRTEAETWRYLSMLAGNEGDYPTALELVTRAREMFAEVGDAEGEGTALVGTATVHYQQGRFADARAALERARPVFRRSGHRYREAVVLGNLGTIAAGQGELAAALGWVQEAIELTRHIGDAEALGTNLAVHAEIDAVLGRTDDLRRHATEAVELSLRVRLHALAANALTMLGFADLLDGRPEQALLLVDRALAESEHAPSDRERAFALVVRGDVLLALARHADALAAYEEAEAAFVRMEVGTALEARAKRGRALLALGDVDAARAVAADLAPRLAEAELQGAQADDVAAACWAVLAAAGDPTADEVRVEAVRRLRERAAATGDDGVAAEYLARPAARELLG
jgi:tetratricopeptide (TPR) repeat protein